MDRILILGSTGMLGKALVQSAKGRNLDVYGMADVGADFNFDICDDERLINLIKTLKPDVVVNTVAIVSIDDCEKNPGRAYQVNSRPASLIADICKKIGCYFIQISTDHYYSGDKNKSHSEDAHVVLMNEYARTKYAAECFALTYENSLVVRTNIVGFRGSANKPTFVEWVIASLQNRQPIKLFADMYTSSIDVYTFADILFNLIEKIRPSGILNLASREVFSKKNFIDALALKLNLDTSFTKVGSVSTLTVQRPDSMGLSVEKVEKLLGIRLPSMSEVVDRLAQECEKGKLI